MQWLNRQWYQSRISKSLWPLLPLSWLFSAIVKTRRALYRSHIFPVTTFSVPIIVVGNLTVGGTGKTPFVIWLTAWLKQAGFHPGIVSRGVGSVKNKGSRWVEMTSCVKEVGDEALLIKQKTKVPFVIDRDRVRAVKTLLAGATCDVIISDDGLQHYRLGRQIEIVMVDGERHFGNQQLLPAGPLREGLFRLKEADFIVYNTPSQATDYAMEITPFALVSLDKKRSFPLHKFPEKTIHAVAGIGHPERFFNALRQAGFTVIPHIFPDHHHYQSHEFAFHDHLPIVMTEKDAVKCLTFSDERYWYMETVTSVSLSFQKKLIKCLVPR